MSRVLMQSCMMQLRTRTCSFTLRVGAWVRVRVLEEGTVRITVSVRVKGRAGVESRATN